MIWPNFFYLFKDINIIYNITFRKAFIDNINMNEITVILNNCIDFFKLILFER